MVMKSTTKCSLCMCQCMSVLFDVNEKKKEKKKKREINSENDNELQHPSAVCFLDKNKTSLNNRIWL